MSEVGGYVLRIAKEQWVDQVFNMTIYYSSMSRNWKHGQTILFLHRTGVGDALVGYGLIDRVCEKEQLSEPDKRECERGDWKRAIQFTYVKQFDKPLALKNTFLAKSKLRGRYFHGLKLTTKQIETLLTQAEA